jgi:hypothetical protein
MNGKIEKMNMEIQKKWFIYIGDHHEGPFSVEEISAKQKTGEVKTESYVWCEGMSDWQMLSSVTELSSELRKINTEEAAPTPLKLEKKEKPNRGPAVPEKTSKSGGKMAGIALGTLLGLIILSVGGLAVLSHTASDDLHGSLRPTLVTIVDRFPFLSNVFKLVPNLNDIKPDEQIELEQAQIGLPENGVKAAFALSQSDANRPFFYVSTNLPHQTKLDLYLVGNSETLLNRLNFTTQTTLTVLHGFAKSDVLLADGGQPLPKGEYQVFITESAEQDESVKKALSEYQPARVQVKVPAMIPASNHFLFTKNYFIGGPRDETYLTRLKAFHEKVKQNAEKEVLELRQYSDTLQLQYTTLTGEFTRLSKNKKITPQIKTAWKKTSETWQQINGQLDQTIQTWSKETLQNEFFYGKAYSLVKGAYEAIKVLFTLENSFFDAEKGVDKASFDIQHGKALSEARDAVELLRSKVDLIMKTPKTPSGLPTREGL